MDTAVWTAIAEPSRFRIVELLRDRPRSVGEIAQRLRIRQPQASKHLRVLHEAGLVQVRAAAQQRIYHLEAKPFQDLGVWLDSFRQLWDKRYAKLEDLLEEMETDEKRSVKKGGKR